jgi:hypothetical protein
MASGLAQPATASATAFVDHGRAQLPEAMSVGWLTSAPRPAARGTAAADPLATMAGRFADVKPTARASVRS